MTAALGGEEALDFDANIGNMRRFKTSVLEGMVVTIDESNMFAYQVTPIYSGTDVVLKIDDIFLAADFDHDDDVDGADFMIWQAGHGLAMQVDNMSGDANGDGVVNGEDLSIWGTQFGSTFAALAFARTVPEPSTAWLLLFAATQLGSLRRCS